MVLTYLAVRRGDRIVAGTAALGYGRGCRPGANRDGNTLSYGPSLRVTRTVTDDPLRSNASEGLSPDTQ